MAWQDLGQVTPSNQDIADIVYPVGAIYISVNNTNPSTLFGGTWQKLEDTFLYATSKTADTNSTTATDGEATHTLTTNEMPSHTHDVYIKRGNYTESASGNTTITVHSTQGSSNAGSFFNQVNGGGQAHNNMPPYMKVYMWKRTA